MKKLFFPIVMVVGLTAMSFTKANNKVSIQEVSLKRLTAVDIKGVIIVTEHLNTETLRIYIDRMKMKVPLWAKKWIMFYLNIRKKNLDKIK